jgi:DNA helicase-2/ATP-dependent DNA helicase PcrA
MRQLYLLHARRRALFGAHAYGLRSRFLDEIPAELIAEAPERFVPPLLAGGGRGGAGADTGAWPASGAVAERASAPSFRLGEDVVHAAFGDGVVTGVEPGGVIVVRFAGDGSERKLMAEYAPVSRR